LGQYFANLLIPSLHIKAESNVTFNANNHLSDNYRIDLKVEEPIALEAVADMNVTIDEQLMAKVFDISLTSNTFSHLNTRSRTSVVSPSDDETLVFTNITLEDRLNHMSATYESTLIRRTTCPTITLWHNVTTSPQSLLYFSSNVSEVCDSVSESSQMAINISLSSDVWHLANAELTQIFNFGKNDGSESMNASHPLMDVSVVANWDRNAKLLHLKRAKFFSKVTDFIPSFDIEFKKYKELPNQLLISISKEVPNILDDFSEDTVRDEL